MLGLLERFGQADCVPIVLDLLNDKESEDVQAVSITVLNRFGAKELTDRLIASYPKLSESLRSRSRDGLFSRPESAGAFLKLIEKKRVDPQDVPVGQLRQIALHENEELNAMVRKHWGRVSRGTPEKKLAKITEFTNDLRSGSGDRARAKELFTKNCGNCHKLFGEGNTIGPDLTAANRENRTELLAQTIDPSAIIRKEYASYVVVTTNGRVLNGLIAEQDGASVTLLDTENKRTNIPLERVTEMNESPTSLMPELLLEKMTMQERRDLFSYLQGTAG